MAGVIATIPKYQFSGALGVPLASGTLETYVAGSSTPATTWQDEALTIANTNPIVLDSRGECVLWLDVAKKYKFILKNVLGAIQWTQDNIAGSGFSTEALRVLLAASSGSSLIGFIGVGGGAVARTVQDKDRDIVNVKDFGAKGDGVTNDTAAIMAADLWCRTQTPPVELQFGSGTYMVSQLVVNVNSMWRGNGKNSTTIKQIIGSNTDLVYGINSNTNWGNSAPTLLYPYDFSIKQMTFDGNWNSGTGNTSGSGIAIMGDHCIMEHVYVKNCAEHGIRTEFVGDSNNSYDSRFLESSYSHIAIDFVGKHGWWFKGPHDSIRTDVRVVDAGQATANTWDGFCNEGSSARDVTIHAASRSGRLRMRYAVNLFNAASHEFSGGCNIEGAGTACLRIASQNCKFDPSTRIYAPFGATTVLLEGECHQNVLRGSLDTGGGTAAPYGITFGNAGADNVTDNDIDMFMVNQNAGAVLFQAGDKGRNTIRVKVVFSANVSITGVPNVQSRLIFEGLVNGASPLAFDTWNQYASRAVGAGATDTWTFPYAFRAAPNVQATIGATGTAPTLPMYITAITTTSVTVRNPNASPLPVLLAAVNAA